jgi:hypothetical protein
MSRAPRPDPADELDRIESALAEAVASTKAKIAVDVEPLAQDIARICDALIALPQGGGKRYLTRLGDLVAGLDDLRAQLEASAEAPRGPR